MGNVDCDVFNFYLWGVVGSVICCFGFCGNLLSLVTFQRDRRCPSTTLLQCLAASDFLLLLAVFVTDALPYICGYTGTCANPWLSWPYIRYVWILTPVSHMCSIWFVVLIAVNRFWAVCRPHSTASVWDNRKTGLYVLAALALVVSFNLPRFFEYEIVTVVQADNSTRLIEERTEFGQTLSYKVVYKVMLVNILLVMLPIVSLIVLTAFILNSLKKNRKRMNSRKSMSTRDTTSGAPSPANTRKMKTKGKPRAASEITFVLVLVVMVAIVCQTPLAAFHFVRYSKFYQCGDVVFYLDNVSKLLVNINSCVNFIIYCLFSPKFRRLLLQTVTCSNPGQVSPGPQATTVAPQANQTQRDDRQRVRDTAT